MKQTKIDMNDKFINQLEEQLERAAESKIFTLRIMNDREENADLFLELLVVFENKEVMEAKIKIEKDHDNKRLGVRIQGNFI